MRYHPQINWFSRVLLLLIFVTSGRFLAVFVSWVLSRICDLLHTFQRGRARGRYTWLIFRKLHEYANSLALPQRVYSKIHKRQEQFQTRNSSLVRIRQLSIKVDNWIQAFSLRGCFELNIWILVKWRFERITPSFRCKYAALIYTLIDSAKLANENWRIGFESWRYTTILL